MQLVKAFVKQMFATRDHRLLAEFLFGYLAKVLAQKGMGIFVEPISEVDSFPLFSYGELISLANYPATFWPWVSQFDTADGVLPISINTCKWEHMKVLGGVSFIMMLDNAPACRTYLIVQNCNVGKINQTFCRIGGEEFMLLMIGTHHSETKQRAESIRKCIEETKNLHSESSTSQYLIASVSYASITSDKHQFDFDLLYGKADKALYQAKDSGRNRIVSAQKRRKVTMPLI